MKTGDDGEAGPPGAPGIAGPAGPPSSKSGGAVYVRWGRKICPENSSLVYEGMVLQDLNVWDACKLMRLVSRKCNIKRFL